MFICWLVHQFSWVSSPSLKLSPTSERGRYFLLASKTSKRLALKFISSERFHNSESEVPLYTATHAQIRERFCWGEGDLGGEVNHERLHTFALLLIIALILFLLCLPYPVAAQDDADILRVPADYPTIAAAIDAAPIGATIEIAAGEYDESLTITRSLTLRGTGETILRGTSDSPVILIQDTHAVVIEHLTITGGQYGVSVLRSRRVTIQHNVITENRLLGVRVRMASAHILNNIITHTQPPYGRGIHIMNTLDYPESRIIGNTVSYNAMAGIITNMVITVYIADNIVTHNGHRGIAITEMSRALVANNFVEDNGETGIYVTDSSTAIVCGNIVIDSQVLSVEGAVRYGNGITIDFGSTVELRGNTVTGSDNYGISVLSSSLVTLNENILNDNEAGALWVDDTAVTVTDATLPEECG
jgi:parallel beta-helix repeat protein